MRGAGLTLALTATALGLALPGAAGAHPERPAGFPDGSGTFPKVRTSGGPKIVVCKPDSRARIRRLGGRVEQRNLRLLERCQFRHIQAAVDAAGNGTRIIILPGVYREQPSRRQPNPDPDCDEHYVEAATNDGRMVPDYQYELECPNSRNLIAILGDSDGDGDCDAKCGLQLEGAGPTRRAVKVVGDPTKQNVFKADRADGIVFTNMLVQYSDYNNFYVLETDGFRFQDITSRWSNEYGFLSFVSDHGIYRDLNAYGAGDAGIYPGSGPPTEGRRFGIRISRVNSHHNLQGNSGSAASGTLYRRNRFHHNGVGIVVDSFSTGHPGSPEDNVVWRRNLIYDNNEDYFTDARLDHCERPYPERNLRLVCPAIMVPIGTGLLIAGGNDNTVARNRIWGNGRYGVMQFFVEAAFRGEDDPTKQTDTSHGNRYLHNRMGVGPGGVAAPNGTDFWWDEAGGGNCWEGNTGPGGARPTTDPPPAPGPLPPEVPGFMPTSCPGSSIPFPVDPLKHAFLVPCAAWDPSDPVLRYPPGCDWFDVPE